MGQFSVRTVTAEECRSHQSECFLFDLSDRSYGRYGNTLTAGGLESFSIQGKHRHPRQCMHALLCTVDLLEIISLVIICCSMLSLLAPQNGRFLTGEQDRNSWDYNSSISEF